MSSYFICKMRSTALKFLLSLSIVLGFLLTRHEASSSEPLKKQDQWTRYSSEHFETLIKDKYKEQSQNWIQMAEAIYTQMKPIFIYAPEKIRLVFKDNSDSPNGLATQVPYPIIYIDPVLPSFEMGVRDSDDWIREVITHELAHIFSFYPTGSLHRVVKLFIGNAYVPNFIFTPSWFHEGFAIAAESSFTSGGRINSPDFANLRFSLRKDKNLYETYDRIFSRSIPYWPYGARVYFYGSEIFKEALTTHPKESLGELNIKTSKQYPYFVKQTFQSIYGQDSKTLFRKSLNKENTEKIKPHRVGKNLKNFAPSPNKQWLAKLYISSTGTSLVLQNLINKEKLTFAVTGTQSLNWSPSGSHLFLDQVHPYKENSVRDIYVWDSNKPDKYPKIITENQHAVSPASVTKHSFFYIEVSSNQHKIYFTNTLNKKNKPVYVPENGTKLSHLLYSPHNKQLYFLEKAIGQNRQLYSYSLRTKTKELIPIEGSLSFISPKSSTQFFAGTFNGFYTQLLIYNLNSNSFSEVSNIKEPALLAYEDINQNIQYLTYTARGTQLKKVESPVLLPGVTIHKHIIPKPKPLSLKDSPTETRYLYRFNDFIPRYWVPMIAVLPDDDQQGLYISGFTSSKDPLGHHFYSVFGAWDTITQKPHFGLNYANSQNRIKWSLQVQRSLQPLTGPIVRTSSSGGAGLSYGHSFSQFTSLGLGLSLTNNSYNISNGQQTTSTFKEYSILTSFSLRSANRRGRSAGWSLSLSDRFSPEVNNSFKRHQLQGSLSYSSSIPILSPLSIGMSANGLWANDQLPSALSSYTTGFLSTAPGQSSWLLRGYSTSQFYLTKQAGLFHLTLNYPLYSIYRGLGRLPIFIDKIVAKGVLDALSTKGFGFSTQRNRFIALGHDDWILGTGAELHVYTQLFYHLPFNLIFALYKPLNSDFSQQGKLVPYVGFQIAVSLLPANSPGKRSYPHKSHSHSDSNRVNLNPFEVTTSH